MSTTGYANAPFKNLRLFLLSSAWLHLLGLAVGRSHLCSNGNHKKVS
ncbi:hypothetical protein [Nostoc sp.]